MLQNYKLLHNVTEETALKCYHKLLYKISTQIAVQNYCRKSCTKLVYKLMFKIAIDIISAQEFTARESSAELWV